MTITLDREDDDLSKQPHTRVCAECKAQGRITWFYRADSREDPMRMYCDDCKAFKVLARDISIGNSILSQVFGG